MQINVKGRIQSGSESSGNIYVYSDAGYVKWIFRVPRSDYVNDLCVVHASEEARFSLVKASEMFFLIVSRLPPLNASTFLRV